MNMNNNPTIDELKDIFAACDDDAGHHLLWVQKNGDVMLSVVPEHLTPVGFEEATTQMQMRYETFVQGNKYVGTSAAADQSFMQSIFDSLLKEWPSAKGRSTVDYIDMF
ncbi:hypothetical protein ACH5Y9_08280 [Methylomonas sp. BW4-1]|uniref:hypothetical protein n=1 Tax=Methylomonas sp. BW4-1 TaxID=3376685 RepID=UPI00404151A9